MQDSKAIHPSQIHIRRFISWKYTLPNLFCLTGRIAEVQASQTKNWKSITKKEITVIYSGLLYRSLPTFKPAYSKRISTLIEATSVARPFTLAPHLSKPLQHLRNRFETFKPLHSGPCAHYRSFLGMNSDENIIILPGLLLIQMLRKPASLHLLRNNSFPYNNKLKKHKKVNWILIYFVILKTKHSLKSLWLRY